MNPQNLLDENDIRTNKKQLNENAIKFRLERLYSQSIRYEVIYKNLLRDVRKFYCQDFNEQSRFIKKKRKLGENFFRECLSNYVDARFGRTFESFDATKEDIMYSIGSLVYPKETLKLAGQNAIYR